LIWPLYRKPRIPRKLIDGALATFENKFCWSLFLRHAGNSARSWSTA
jgi:hypothetical protein